MNPKKRSIDDSISYEDIQVASYICLQTKYMHAYALYARDISFINFNMRSPERLFPSGSPSFISDVRSLFYRLMTRNNTELKDLSYLHAHA